ncbi:chemotaxis protein CheA [Chrysiogenes arsenatis]|uniref:chemotaxis protein CheA n=1 Tax=Chrysiogenes arsenatis TaxID=309797 RepID=UPI0004130676|nr:chemotaxis protein CheA [Chrysiogenes arsenatis]
MMDEQAELRYAFSVEVGELLEEIENALQCLQDDHANSEALNQLFRAVHTLKGSAAIMGFALLEELCHSVEYLLVSLRQKSVCLTVPFTLLLVEFHQLAIPLINALLDTPELSDAALLQKYDDVVRRIQEYSVPMHDVANKNTIIATLSEDEMAGFDMDSPPIVAPSRPNAEHAYAVLNQEKRLIRVDALRLDELIDLSAEMVTATAMLESLLREQRNQRALEGVGIISLLAKQVQEKTMSFRMVPIHTLFRRFPRIVQSTAAELGKEVQLHFHGGETELEKNVADKLYDPLLHMIRNALDHGLELPQERKTSGKQTQGIIRLHAAQEAGYVIISLRDDGRGIQRERIVASAVQKGLIASPEGALSDREVLDILCLQGFSTTEVASKLSGRGVGMDVVRATISALRGHLELASEPQSGTCFTIRIPLSLSVVDAFLVGVGTTKIVIPIAQIQETIAISPAEERKMKEIGYTNLRGAVLPCMRLRGLLHVEYSAAEADQYIIVVRHSGRQIGLLVQYLYGEVKAVVKPLGKFYQDVPYFAGATILPDGSIAFVLEVSAVVIEE